MRYIIMVRDGPNRDIIWCEATDVETSADEGLVIELLNSANDYARSVNLTEISVEIRKEA